MAFTVVPACRLAELPNAAPCTEGFRGFVTSSTTPIATGRSDCCQAGLSPAENPHLSTTHAKDRHGALAPACHMYTYVWYLCQVHLRLIRFPQSWGPGFSRSAVGQDADRMGACIGGLRNVGLIMRL